jgi:hypothetical protein
MEAQPVTSEAITYARQVHDEIDGLSVRLEALSIELAEHGLDGAADEMAYAVGPVSDAEDALQAVLAEASVGAGADSR